MGFDRQRHGIIVLGKGIHLSSSLASSVPSEADRLAPQRHRNVAAEEVIYMLGEHPRHEL